MRRILLAAAMLAIVLSATSPAEARHGHCGWGGGYSNCGYGYGGYRGFGYGGYSPGWCGSGIGLSIGYGLPYGGYRSCYPNYSYPCYGASYYYPAPIGYYGYYGSTYSPSSNFSALNIAPAFASAPRATVAAELLAALRAPAALPRIAADKPVARMSNAEQRRKADLYLALGDTLFRGQKFHSALQRYKLAAATAPDMPEAFWRQGHALIATGNYQLAGGAFKRAIALDPDTGRDGFTLDALYGAALIAKTAHMEGLAGWALDHGDSSEAYFLMAVTLHYDGQAERADKFFARAAEMAGDSGGHIAAFESAVAPEAFVESTPPAAPPAKGLPVSAGIEI